MMALHNIHVRFVSGVVVIVEASKEFCESKVFLGLKSRKSSDKRGLLGFLCLWVEDRSYDWPCHPEPSVSRSAFAPFIRNSCSAISFILTLSICREFAVGCIYSYWSLLVLIFCDSFAAIFRPFRWRWRNNPRSVGTGWLHSHSHPAAQRQEDSDHCPGCLLRIRPQEDRQSCEEGFHCSFLSLGLKLCLKIIVVHLSIDLNISGTNISF